MLVGKEYNNISLKSLNFSRISLLTAKLAGLERPKNRCIMLLAL